MIFGLAGDGEVSSSDRLCGHSGQVDFDMARRSSQAYSRFESVLEFVIELGHELELRAQRSVHAHEQIGVLELLACAGAVPDHSSLENDPTAGQRLGELGAIVGQDFRLELSPASLRRHERVNDNPHGPLDIPHGHMVLLRSPRVLGLQLEAVLLRPKLDFQLLFEGAGPAPGLAGAASD